MTEAAIDRDANRLAQFLLARGVTAHAQVGIEHEGSYAMSVAALAVRKAGATCVRLDPSRPEPERRERAAETRVTLVLTVDEALYEVPAVPVSLVASFYGAGGASDA